jgi:hypothetical protein
MECSSGKGLPSAAGAPAAQKWISPLGFAAFRFALFVPATQIKGDRDACLRNLSARARSTMVLATTMPPMDKPAMLWAAVRRRQPFLTKLRSNTLTIALNTVSKARYAGRRWAMPPWGRNSRRPRNAGEIGRHGRLAALRRPMNTSAYRSLLLLK